MRRVHSMFDSYRADLILLARRAQPVRILRRRVVDFLVSEISLVEIFSNASRGFVRENGANTKRSTF